MKKLVSLALVLMLITSLFAFTSCETSESLIADASAALLSAPYTVTMSMDFDCDDETLSAVFDAMTMEIPVTIDGDKVAMDMEMDYMGMKIGIDMTVVDKVLYYDMSLAGESTKMKCTLTDKEFEEFLAENSAEMPVEPSQFAEQTMEKKDGKYVITCAGITDEGSKALNDIMGESLADLDGTVGIGDLSYILTIKDGKFESMALTCSYTITVADQNFTVTMTMNAAYSYDKVESISAPANVDQYQDVSYSDIIG